MTNTQLTLAVGATLLTFGSTIMLDYNIYASVLGYLAAASLWFAVDAMEDSDV